MSVSNYHKLGDSGLSISKLIVGCMSYGSKKWADWVIEDKQEVFKILKTCYDAGLRTYDTADVYSNGVSEKLLGEFLKEYNIPRQRVVILTKVFCPIDESNPGAQFFGPEFQNDADWGNSKGLSRRYIFDAVKKSVERLGTYIDVYQIHRLDRETPKKEIMRALNDVVLEGYTRYIGASTMRAVEFAELQFIAEQNGWFKFISMQNFYNLIYREEEREMIPFCQESSLGKVGCIPWSPIARGVLARPYGAAGNRGGENDPYIKIFGLGDENSPDKQIIDRTEEIAKKHGVAMATVATAWVISKGHSPIVGINKVERVADCLKALELKLSAEEIEYLEAPYSPKNCVL